MIRLLVKAEAPVASDRATRFGGLPLISADSDFQWPLCATCNGPMQFLGQLALEDSTPSRLALLFMCQNDPGLCDEWDPDQGGNRALVVTFHSAGHLAPAPQTGAATRNTVYGAQIEAVDVANYDQARQQWAENNHRSTREVLGTLGGQPSWLQADETPTCNSCGKKMSFLAQLEEGPDARTSMNFGGGGCAYLFLCSCQQNSAKFLWQ